MVDRTMEAKFYGKHKHSALREQTIDLVAIGRSYQGQSPTESLFELLIRSESGERIVITMGYRDFMNLRNQFLQPHFNPTGAQS